MGRFIPRGSDKAVWVTLLACVLFVAAPVGLLGQTANNVRTFYVPARSFNIPFGMNDNDPRIEVLLNVSRDGRQYQPAGIARTNERRFHFSAPSDGWYYFIVQTRDSSGVAIPDLRTAPPSMRVCVDTQPPVIEELAADTSADNSLPSIRWKITEANLKEIWADYRSINGGEWVPLFLPLKEEGKHPWKPHWLGELEVRMQVLDQANQKSEVRTLRLRAANNVTHMPPPPDSAGSGKIMYVKSKTFQLNYTLDDQTIGPSQVASVDIWKLHPGQIWRKCSEKGPPKGPATVSVDTAGRWGFRLIPRSGVGLAERDPQPGDAPDIWVEVDDKPPLVKVTNVTVTQETDGGYLTVYWKADDTFLRALPITISMASPQGKDWAPVAKDLPNNGHWRQKTDDLNLGARYEFALKVTAIDEAGNIGENQWGDTVKVDLKVPRIKHIDVKPGGGQETYGTSGASFGNSSLESQPTSKPAASPYNGSGQSFNELRR